MSKSTRKSLSRPLSAPSTPHSHWAPQTPHGTRAVQVQLHRSGGRNAHTNRRKSGVVQKPWSVRRTLRALSKAALNEPSRLRIPPDPPSRKRLSSGEEKENDLQPAKMHEDVEQEDDEEEERQLRAKRPRLSLPIDQERDDEREGTPLPEAPTPSVLNDDEDEENENPTLKSIEYGRRAISEGPISRRFSRPSFGSIRMSDFTAADLKDYGVSPGAGGKRLFQLGNDYEDNILAIGDDEMGVEAAEDTGDLYEARQSLGFPDVNETTLDLQATGQEDQDTFRLNFNMPERSPSFAELGRNRSQRGNHSAASSPTSPVAANLKSQQTQSSRAPLSNSSSASPISSPTHAPKSALQAPTDPPKPRKQKYKLSRHNLKVPALPSSLQKRLANSALSAIGRRKSKIGRDSLRAIEQATEWFFEQVGEDLEAYSNHAGRKKRVDEGDVVALMKR